MRDTWTKPGWGRRMEAIGGGGFGWGWGSGGRKMETTVSEQQ